MSDVSPWLVRIDAQWFPAGTRFIVTCGQADWPYEQGRWLHPEEGWRDQIPPEPGQPTSSWLRHLGIDDFWTRQAINRHMADSWCKHLLLGHVDDIMFDPRAWQGVTISAAFGDTNPMRTP